MWVFFLLLLVLALVLQRKMGTYALRSVSAALETDRQLADPGEPVTLTIRLENHGRLPILYLKVSVSLPRETESMENRIEVSEIFRMKKYVFACYLLPGQRLERHVPITFPSRGVWHLGGVQLNAGDLLGIREDCESRNITAMVVTAPPPLQEMNGQEAAGGLMGDLSARRWIHEDPILSAGYQEYTGHEPQRSIAWTRSLASGRMMVRNYDHTTDRRVRVLLLVKENTEGDLLENLFSAVRTLCDQLERDSVPYSLASNGELYSFWGSVERVENGLGTIHKNRILDSLGRAGYGVRFSMQELIQKEIRSGDPVQGYVLAAVEPGPEIRLLRDRLEQGTGAQVRALSVPPLIKEKQPAKAD